MQDLEVIDDVVTVRLVGRDDKPGECRFSLDARGELIYAYDSLAEPWHDVWSHMQTNWKFQLNAGLIAAVANTLRDAARKAMTPPAVKEPWPLRGKKPITVEFGDAIPLADEIRERTTALNRAIGAAFACGVRCLPKVTRAESEGPMYIRVEHIVLTRKL